MVRAKSAVAKRKRRKKVLKMAKGYRGGRRKLYKTARETVNKGLMYASRDRKRRKRDFRRLWTTRISAAAMENGLSYSNFMGGLKKKGIELDRKVLASLAVEDPVAFKKIASLVKEVDPEK